MTLPLADLQRRPKSRCCPHEVGIDGLTLASDRSSPLFLNDLHVWCFGTSLAIRDAVGIVSLEAANPTLPWRNFTRHANA
jgi:hypothetical protein